MNNGEQIKLSKGCLFLQNPPLGMNQTLWNELCKLGEVKTYPAHFQICKEGEIVDNVYILIGGYALIQKANKALDIVEPGESLGAGLLQSDMKVAKYPLSAKTIKPCDILKITANDLISILQKNPEINFYFLKQIQKRMCFLQVLNVITRMPVNQRVAHFLIKKEHLLGIGFITRKLIAEILNTTTESVIRAMSEFVDHGMIKGKKKQIVLTEKIHSFILCQKIIQT